MKTWLTLLALAGLTAFANGQFPPFIKVCKRNSDLNECVKQNILLAKKYVKKGIPKLYVPPTNPFKITSVSVESPTLKVEMSKFNAYGVHQFDLNDLNIDLDNNKFEIDINFKYIEATTMYKFDGELVGIPLKAEGPARGNMSDLGLVVSMSGKRSERGGKTYIDFEDKSVVMRFDKTAYAFYENLFPNRELTEVTNRIFNENINEMIYELQPIIEETFGVIISESISKLFQRYSIDELFPL